MGQVEVRNAIRQRFEAQSPVSAIAWDSFGAARYEPPAVDPSDPAAGVWVRPMATERVGSPFLLGDGQWTLFEGAIVVQVFGPLGLGENHVASYADTIAGIFRYARFSPSIECLASRVEWVGPDRELPFFQVNVVTPYRRVVRTDGTLEDETAVIFTRASHGLAVGDAVYESAEDVHTKAQADDPSTLASGLVTWVAGDSYRVATIGSHSLTLGLGSYGDIYLSQGTAGLITTTAPTSGWSQRLGGIVNANLVRLAIEPGQLL